MKVKILTFKKPKKFQSRFVNQKNPKPNLNYYKKSTKNQVMIQFKIYMKVMEWI